MDIKYDRKTNHICRKDLSTKLKLMEKRRRRRKCTYLLFRELRPTINYNFFFIILKKDLTIYVKLIFTCFVFYFFLWKKNLINLPCLKDKKILLFCLFATDCCIIQHCIGLYVIDYYVSHT